MPRLFQRAAYLFLYLIIPFFLVLAIRTASPDILVRFFPDDAFYYLQTASHLAGDGVVSFDGINTTTGFHPLQLLLASAVLFLLGKSKALIFFFLFNAVALAASFWLMLKAADADEKTLLASAVLTLPVFNFYLYTSSGMESALLVIVVSAFYFQLFRLSGITDLNTRSAAILGITLGLAILCRLDMVIPLGLVVAYLGLEAAKSRRYRELLIMMIAAGLVIAPFLVWIYGVQGNIFPVSSIAKYGKERWDFQGVMRALTSGAAVGYLLLAVLLLVPLAAIPVGLRRLGHYRDRVLLATAGSSLLYLGYVVFVAHAPFKWYLNYCSLVATILCLEWISRYRGVFKFLPRGFPAGLAAACLLLNSIVMLYWSRVETTSLGMFRLTETLNDIVPANSSLATNDAGIVGYFSTSRVHNLDGLANSLSNWNEFLSTAQYPGYLRAYRIDYVLVRNELLNDRLYSPNATAKPLGLEAVRTFQIPRFGEQTLVRIIR